MVFHETECTYRPDENVDLPLSGLGPAASIVRSNLFRSCSSFRWLLFKFLEVFLDYDKLLPGILLKFFKRNIHDSLLISRQESFPADC